MAFVNDLARTPQDRQAIEFRYAGVGPGARSLRDALSATMKDADFIADAKKQKLDYAPETASSSQHASNGFMRRSKA